MIYEILSQSKKVNKSRGLENFLKKKNKRRGTLIRDPRLSSNMIGKAIGGTNHLHKLLLTDRQVVKLCTTFANS